jgi:hypothetical protein
MRLGLSYAELFSSGLGVADGDTLTLLDANNTQHKIACRRPLIHDPHIVKTNPIQSNHP